MKCARLSFGVALLLGGAGSVVACATADEASGAAGAGGNPSAIGDAAKPEGEPTTDARTPADARTDDAPPCSAAGWCQTTLPDDDLSLKDIWPVGARAFALAQSPTLGVKLLEWDDVGQSWSYIDDGSQNAAGLGSYVGRIWAPDEDEVYYVVAPSQVFHGTRPVAPATAWTWTSQKLPDGGLADDLPSLVGYPSYLNYSGGYYEGMADRYPALGIWGTGKDDVYAWSTNIVYHLSSVDGGPRQWVVDYVAPAPEAPNEHLFFLGAAGVGRDAVWFSGARARDYGSCSLLVSKTSAGYRIVVDGALPDNTTCSERAGALHITGSDGTPSASSGWLSDLQATSATELLGLKGARDVVKITAGQNEYSIGVSPVPTTISPRALFSFWSASGEMWFSAQGLVVQGQIDFGNGGLTDGGTYGISTLAVHGAPVGRPIYQVRGTSNTNLWAIGVRNALHKTTP